MADKAIVVSFTARIDELEREMKAVSKVLEKEFAKPTEEASKGAIVNYRDIKKGVRDLGRELATVSPLAAEAVHAIGGIKPITSAVADVAETAGKALIGFLSTPAGITVASVAAVGAAFAGAAIALSQMDEEARRAAEAMKILDDAHKKYNETLEKIAVTEAILGRSSETAKAKFGAETERIRAAVAAYAKFLGIQESLAVIMLAKGQRPAPPPIPKPVTAYDGIVPNDASIQRQLRWLDNEQEIRIEYGRALAALKLAIRAEKEFENASDYWGDYVTPINDAIKAHEKLTKEIEKSREATENAAEAWRYDQAEKANALTKERLEYYDQINLKNQLTRQTEQSTVQFYQWAASLGNVTGQVLGGVQQTVEGVAAGVGQVFAQCIVYGEDWGKAFAELGKRMLADFISMLAQMIIKYIAFAIISAIVGAQKTTAEMTGIFAVGAAAAAQSALAGLPFPANLVMAPVAAGAAIAIMTSASLSGAAAGTAAATAASGPKGLAKGGIIFEPTAAIFGEAGPEVAAPLSWLEDRLSLREPGRSTVVFEVDGREMARGIIPWIPGALRLKGIRA